MESSYWKQKWEMGEIGFHLDRPHPQLVRHFSDVEPGRVMVPLCGKSNDLVWLRQQGHQVVGVELSRLACESFFAEHGIAHTVRTDGGFTVFEADGITIWCGDFFATPDAAWVGCTAVYDRAALIALPEEMRSRYAAEVIRRWAVVRGAPMLLITVEYPAPEPIGPPFSVEQSEVTRLYGQEFEIRQVNEARDPILSNRAPKFSGIEVLEKVYRLRKL